nr:hypothetical protein Itr_chr13CG09090 [Ipomoea trifida]
MAVLIQGDRRTTRLSACNLSPCFLLLSSGKYQSESCMESSASLQQREGSMSSAIAIFTMHHHWRFQLRHSPPNRSADSSREPVKHPRCSNLYWFRSVQCDFGEPFLSVASSSSPWW